MAKKYLRNATQSDRKNPVIVSVALPVISGGESTVPYYCPACDAELITRCSIERICNIRIKCPICAAMLAGWHVRRGSPIGLAKPAIILKHGRHGCDSTLDLAISDTLLIVSQTLVNRRNRELGLDQKTADDVLSTSGMRAALDGLRPYFGKKLGAIRHPQFRSAITAIESAIKDKVDGEQIVLKDRHIAELYTLSNTVKHWRKSPYFKKFIAEYKADYIHASCLIAAAKYIIEQGNDVEVVQEAQGERRPDLMLAPAWNIRVSTEIKAPERLRNSQPLSYEEAKTVVERAFKSAGTQKGGQLSPDRPGLLIIGSFYLDSTSLDMLVKAAHNDFKRTSTKRKHILAAIFVNIDRVALHNAEGTIYGVRTTTSAKIVNNQEYDKSYLVDLVS